ncbi:MAG TPA: lysophospholipid acyltransferase family protein [Candidatus Polarisedimenticolaceae bacterium]|nr:lysophospholipid acyltransferase family protein [Candidatus Polarisedimenticolaceae bacterium]
MKSLRRALRLAALYAFQVGFVRPMLRWYWGARYRRLHYVPTGPCIVVANHNSHLDAALLMSMFPLRRLPHVHPVAAADYFGKTAWRRAVAMVWMNAMGIERTAPPGKDVLSPMIEALEDGETLIFFPEGSRGEPGVVGPFRPGIGRIVKSVPGVQVVPVFLAGAERSLPRGESVPLPLGIDVIIGKPRTFSTALDARDIAEEARADVLALAPAAPPVPGPRPAPPIRVAFCGVDGEVNRALYVATRERLESLGRTVGLGAGPDSDPGVPAARSLGWPKALAWIFRTGGIYRGDAFARMIRRARVDESLEDGRTARFVVSEGSPLVDLLAWSEAHLYRGAFDDRGLQQVMVYLSGERRIPLSQWVRFVRRAPEVWLVNTFDLAHPAAPDVLVLDTGDARSSHEADLHGAYRQVAGILRKRRVEVVEVEGRAVAAAAVADIVEGICRRLVTKGDARAADA